MSFSTVLFWAAAAALSAAVSWLVLHFAARTAREAGAPDPAVTLLRRQMDEIDELAARGVLAPQEQASARAESGRRLLAAADRDAPPWTAGRPATRKATLAGVVGVAVAAAALYAWLGAPSLPDQPFAHRLAAWRAADPLTLDAPQMAAVLEAVTRERPGDAQGLDYLGRARLAADDAYGAAQAFSRAAALAPQRSDIQVRLAVALWTQSGAPGDDAVAALRRALTLDPADADARYLLATARVERGDAAGGAADLRKLVADLPVSDPRRAATVQAAERAEQAASLAAAAPGDQRAAIRGMVEGLAARLDAQPDDPQGWARLVRAYGVLGDKPAQAAALARARSLFRGQPGALAAIEAEAGTSAP